MDQGNLMSEIAQVHTQCKNNWILKKIVTLRYQHGQRVQSCNQRGGHRLQHSRTTTFNRETIAWRQRSRIDSENREPPESTRSSTRPPQSQSFNPFSQESKEMIHEVGNIELCELLDTEPKAQCKVCLSYWDVGIVYCTCGHFLRSGTEENNKFVQYTMDLLSIPITTSRKGDPTGTVTGRSQGITSTTSRIRSRSNARRSSSWVSTTGSSETRSSARTCLTSVALKKYVVRWTNWRTKTTRTTSLQNKFVCTETIGGFVRTQLYLIRCQFGIDLTSSKHCQPCDSSKTKRIQLISKDGKAIPHLGGTGKNPGGILLMSITTTTDPALIDQGNLLKSDWATYSRYDSQN